MHTIVANYHTFQMPQKLANLKMKLIISALIVVTTAYEIKVKRKEKKRKETDHMFCVRILLFALLIVFVSL